MTIKARDGSVVSYDIFGDKAIDDSACGNVMVIIIPGRSIKTYYIIIIIIIVILYVFCGYNNN